MASFGAGPLLDMEGEAGQPRSVGRGGDYRNGKGGRDHNDAYGRNWDRGDRAR